MTQELTLDALFEKLWQDYEQITPQATRIHALLKARGESFRNDHIALRTYNLPGVGLKTLAQPFVERGYTQSGEYVFETKKLYAQSFSHPSGKYPRVFISELRTELFDATLQAQVKEIVSQVNPKASALELMLEQPTWPAVSVDTYDALLEKSEFAAWVAAFALRANHFTVSVNDLKTFSGLAELVAFLKSEGFSISSPEQPILGSPDAFFEQCSTRADKVAWTFAGGIKREIPSCYYEFGKRYQNAQGVLFDGFLTDNADKIFHSNFVRQVL